MKQKFSIRWLCATILLLCSTYASAYDFYEKNDDGKTIYYNIANYKDRTCEVTYKSVSYDSYGGNVEIPETVTRSSDGYTYTVIGIGSYAFAESYDLKKVIIPTTVTYINYYAFYWCYSLTEITIPNSVTTIGDEAFYWCYGLREITIPDSVTSIGQYAFYNCNGLITATISDSVTSIGSDAFKGCYSLTEVTLPNSITSIEENTFYGCRSLTKVTIPNSVTSIGNRAFYYSGLTEVTIPNSVTNIGDEAFGLCYLTDVIIPNSVTSIGGGAFEFCSELTEVTIPNSITSIEFMTFENCWSLVSVTIPNSVTNIGRSAFLECYSLTEVTIPNSVTNIGSSAFAYCYSLTEVTIPNSVTNIGGSAFDHCYSLTEVTIPNSVTSIEDYVFYDCTSLAGITIPNSVTSIGKWAFGYCTALESIISFNPEPPTCQSDTFKNASTSTCVLYVPLGTTKAYSEATGWEDFLNIVEVEFNTELYDALYGEICIAQGLLSDSWYTIQTDCPYAVDGSRVGYDALNEELANLLELLQDAYMNVTLTNALAEEIYTQLEEIKKKIEDLFESAKQAETYYELYVSLVAEINNVDTILNNAWITITTNYDKVANDFKDEYDALMEELNKVLEELENAYNNSTFTDELAEETSAKIEVIKKEIENLLAAAKEAYVTAGIDNIFSNLDDDIQIYTLSGARVNTPTKGEVYIILYSDGSTKKIFLK